MPLREIPALTQEPSWERCEEFSGGTNTWDNPILLPPNVTQLLENHIVDDNGEARPRPGADALSGAAVTAASRIEQLVYFDTPALELLVAAVGGTVKKWDGATWTDTADPFGANTVLAMAQGNNVLLCSDGTNPWQSYNGTAWSGSLGSTAADPPVGTHLMCFHTFRMFAVRPANPDLIYVSDLGVPGAGGWDTAADIVYVGRGEGDPIVGMVSFKAQYLAVGKEASIFLVNCDSEAAIADWYVYRLSKNIGVVGGKTMVAHGDILYFLSRSGIRSIIPTTGNDLPYDVSPPLSQPIQTYIDRINWAYASKSCGISYGNLILWAVPLDSATEPNTVLVWNARRQVWMGIWTGWTPTVFEVTRFAGAHRLVIGDSAGFANQFKDHIDVTLDTAYGDNSVSYDGKGRTKSFVFGEPVNLKDAHRVEFTFRRSSGTGTFSFWSDTAESVTWQADLDQVQNELPLELPFDLAVLRTRTIPKFLDGQQTFREGFFEWDIPAGPWILRNISFAAFLDTTSL